MSALAHPKKPRSEPTRDCDWHGRAAPRIIARSRDGNYPLRMSALGQKQTFAVQNVMSALPPKADICSAPGHVRFWANSGLTHRSKQHLY